MSALAIGHQSFHLVVSHMKLLKGVSCTSSLLAWAGLVSGSLAFFRMSGQARATVKADDLAGRRAKCKVRKNK
jgi:hypothetical protein